MLVIIKGLLVDVFFADGKIFSFLGVLGMLVVLLNLVLELHERMSPLFGQKSSKVPEGIGIHVIGRNESVISNSVTYETAQNERAELLIGSSEVHIGIEDVGIAYVGKCGFGSSEYDAIVYFEPISEEFIAAFDELVKNG